MFEETIFHLTWLEIIGTLFGVTQVLLAKKNNLNNYLFGIVSILVGIWVHYKSILYADILLDFYYLTMSIYGYFFWKFGKKHRPAPISYSTKSDFLKSIAIVIACFGLMAYWLSAHTNSDVPIWDAALASFAWAGMWLMAKRKMENWIFLNISNLIAIPLLIYKELYVYSGLTVFLFIIGVLGYLEWQKIYKNAQQRNYQTA